MTENPESAVLVVSRYDPEGDKYEVCVEIGDQSVTVNRTVALGWAEEVLAAIACAEHDAAVVAQLREAGLTPEARTYLITHLRQRRGTPTSTLGNLVLLPGVSAFNGKPFLILLLNNRSIGQWDSADARQHAVHLFEVLKGVELDTAYLKALREYDIPDGTARAMVQNLSQYRIQGERR